MTQGAWLTALPALAIAGGLAGSVLLAAEALRHRGLPAERTRQFAHVASGLAVLPFPWLFREPAPVLWLCGVFATLLALTQWRGGLRSLHGVARRSLGCASYPVAVALVFGLALHRPAIYVTSVLVLALADPAAAFVGMRFGRHRYLGPGGAKSLEGSAAFFAAAALCLLGTHASGVADAGALAIVLAVAAAATLLEAGSPLGSDNITVPVGTCLLLRAWS